MILQNEQMFKHCAFNQDAIITLIMQSDKNRLEIRYGSELLTYMEFPMSLSGRQFAKRVYNALV